MGKWKAKYKLINKDNFIDKEGTVVFEMNDRPAYTSKAMTCLARIAVLEYEHFMNDNLSAHKCLIDLRTVKKADDNLSVNYQLKSDYHEISINIK